MRSLHLIIACCAVVFIGCATGGPGRSRSEDPLPPIVSSQAFAGIIVPRLVNFVDSWTPTQEQVVLAESKVQQCVLSHRRGLRSTLSRYFRQYAGWTVDGRKVLDIGFFDTRHYRVDRLRQPLAVCDGDGETYFLVTFDLESQTCSF